MEALGVNGNLHDGQADKAEISTGKAVSIFLFIIQI